MHLIAFLSNSELFKGPKSRSHLWVSYCLKQIKSTFFALGFEGRLKNAFNFSQNATEILERVYENWSGRTSPSRSLERRGKRECESLVICQKVTDWHL
jgi:hypothetical protein